MALKFDGTISLGNALSMLTVVVAISIAWARSETRVAAVEQRIVIVERAVDTREGRVRALEISQAGTAADIRAITAGIADIKAKLDEMSKVERQGK